MTLYCTFNLFRYYFLQFSHHNFRNRQRPGLWGSRVQWRQKCEYVLKSILNLLKRQKKENKQYFPIFSAQILHRNPYVPVRSASTVPGSTMDRVQTSRFDSSKVWTTTDGWSILQTVHRYSEIIIGTLYSFYVKFEVLRSFTLNSPPLIGIVTVHGYLVWFGETKYRSGLL